MHCQLGHSEDEQGAVFLYVLVDFQWQFVHRVDPPDPSAIHQGAAFGKTLSLAIVDGRIALLVGTPNQDVEASSGDIMSGAVSVGWLYCSLFSLISSVMLYAGQSLFV